MSRVLNITIAAHVDHGKSTLSTRLVNSFQGVEITDLQFTDNLPVEKERGITVRSQVINLMRSEEGVINIIDTPGHFDFQGEVLKALSVTDLVLLLISTREKAQAQTFKYLEAAKKLDKRVWLVLNNFKPVNKQDVTELIGSIRLSPFATEHNIPVYERVYFCCAKDGEGVGQLQNLLIKELFSTSWNRNL